MVEAGRYTSVAIVNRDATGTTEATEATEAIY